MSLSLGIGLGLTSPQAHPLLGPELVTNGGFDADTDWVKGTGWTIAGGVASVVNNASSITQGIAFVAGKTYRVTYTVSSHTAGGVRARFSGGTTTNGATNTGDGTYIEDLVAVTGNVTLAMQSRDAVSGFDLDDISVREVL